MASSTKTKQSRFGWWLTLFLLILLGYASFAFAGAYFLAETIFNGNRWWEFGGFAFAAVLFFVLLFFIDKKMSQGDLGSSMQKLRTSRFSAAFLSLVLASMIAAGLIFLFDGVVHTEPAANPFGALAAFLACLMAVFLFFNLYFIFEGRGVSRL
jgi:hypothetical protein